jgi:hypothetical protein
VTEAPTAGAIERYRQTLFEMAALAGDQGHTSSVRRWNRLVDRQQAERQVLQASPEGRSAIAALMDDPRPTVRLWSASAALFWDEAQARSSLEELREAPARYGLHSITAKHTLIEFDAGRLDETGEPPGRL